MHSFKLVVISLLIGAGATTIAEYIFKYNLLDYLKDKIVGLFHKKAA